MQSAREKEEEENCTYAPEISEYAKSITHLEPIEVRTQKILQLQKEKLERLAKEVEAEKYGHGFKPQTTPYQFKKKRQNFYAEMPARMEEYTNKLKSREAAKKEQDSPPKDQYHPVINKYSQELNREGTIYDRLYNKAREQQDKENASQVEHIEASQLQKNKLLEKSKKDLSPKQVEKYNRLYQEGSELKERKKQRQESASFEANSHRNKSKLSSKSKKIAKDVFMRTLFQPFHQFADSRQETLHYETLCQTLAALHLIDDSAQLSEKETMIVERLFALMAGPEEHPISFEQFFTVLAPMLQPRLFATAHHTDLSRELHSRFLNGGSGATKRKVHVEKPSFKPTLRKTKSRTINKQPGARFEQLFALSGTSNKKLEKLRKASEEAEMKDCSFAPKINHTKKQKKKAAAATTPRFEQLYSQRRAYVPPTTTEEKEYHEHCSFQPEIKKSRQSYQHAINHHTKVRGFEASISRLRKGQQERQRQRNFYDTLRKEQDTKFDRRVSRTQVKEFNFQLKKRKPVRPVLYMDVNLGPGRTGRIGIHQGDDPAILANNFATSYRLDPLLRDRLQQLITENMNANNISITKGYYRGHPAKRSPSTKKPQQQRPSTSSTTKKSVPKSTPASQDDSAMESVHARVDQLVSGYDDDESDYDDDDEYDDEFSSPQPYRNDDIQPSSYPSHPVYHQ
mmetsp:Transcript_2315/g.3354  ORF Transcript_2315/g.3354 Transcript_2315/m.3354 type:complete len:683 (+) Transcript_2315:56-2104(+)